MLHSNVRVLCKSITLLTLRCPGRTFDRATLRLGSWALVGIQARRYVRLRLGPPPAEYFATPMMIAARNMTISDTPIHFQTAGEPSM